METAQIQDDKCFSSNYALDSTLPLAILPNSHLIVDGVQLCDRKHIVKGAFGSAHRALYGGTACAVKLQNYDEFVVVRKSALYCGYTVEDFQ